MILFGNSRFVQESFSNCHPPLFCLGGSLAKNVPCLKRAKYDPENVCIIVSGLRFINYNVFESNLIINYFEIVGYSTDYVNNRAFRNCSILPSRMGEYGVSLENMGNMENRCFLVLQLRCSLVFQLTFSLVLQLDLIYLHSIYGIYCDSWKIITYALGEHDPGSVCPDHLQLSFRAAAIPSDFILNHLWNLKRVLISLKKYI